MTKEIFRLHSEVKKKLRRNYGVENFGQVVIMLIQLVNTRMKKL